MLTFPYSIDQGDYPSSHQNLAMYFDEQLGKQPYARRLTQVVTLNSSKLRDRFDHESHQRAKAQPPVPAPAVAPTIKPGAPWMTMVLGSGCLGDRAIHDVSLMARRLTALAQCFKGDQLADGTAKGALASAFARSLLEDRLGTRWIRKLDAVEPDPAVHRDEPECGHNHDGPDRDPPLEIEADTAILLLVVALLTRLYREAKTLEHGALHRSEPDEIVLDPQTQRYRELKITLIDPIVELITSLTSPESPARPQGDLVAAALHYHLSTTRTALESTRSFSVTDLRLLTEFAWYYVADGCLTYPGWSDLLLWLSIRFPPPIKEQDGRVKPIYRMVWGANSQVRERYDRVTQESWTRLRERPLDSEPTLHDRVADVLFLQASLCGRNPISYALPVASAFVTTFDLELELAMLASPERTPFVVALPTYVRDDNDQARVSIRWLGCVIDPGTAGDDALAAVTDPKEWFLLSGNAGYGKTTEGRRNEPVVVRLTGCPLISLPDLDHPDHQDLAKQIRGASSVDGTSPLTLQPATLIDEYAAMMLTAAESFLDHRDDARLGLPRWISSAPGGENANFARFWMVMGVQVGDSSIRQRLVAQLASPMLTSAPLRTPLDRTGLVVNNKIGPLEGQLMNWQGFDVVEASCEDFGTALAHYAEHLRATQVSGRDLACDPTQKCELGSATRDDEVRES